VNRVAPERLAGGAEARCGRCRTPLPLGGAPLVVGDGNFAEAVERSPVPVLVDAWAPWCGPCRTLAPIVDQLAAELAGRARVAKLNVDENPTTAARFAVRSIPTLLLIKDGREVDRLVGVHAKAEIAQRMERILS
jgi:thioredoxin 2